MHYIDIKVTVWNRLTFSDETAMEKLVELLNIHGIDYIIDDHLGFQESETLYDTEERMEPAENGGASTVEIYQDGKLIWQNGA